MFYEVILGKAMGKGASKLTYASSLPLEPGMIVEVPLNKGKAPGVVLKKVVQPDFQCKEITRILYSKPLPAHLVKLAEWISGYFAAPLSAVMGMILPNGVLKQRREAKTEQDRTGGAEVVGQVFSSSGLKISGTSYTGQPAEPSPTGTNLSVSSGIYVPEILNQDMIQKTPALPPIPLNRAQEKALEDLQKTPGATKLLFGVTGSGKTNIYLKMALKALSEQKSVVLLVPEIALTGQLVKVFQETFKTGVVLIHSRQTEAERHKTFDFLLLNDEPKIVIGPRSALFAPLSNLGLIMIDEEHENTYYQENTPKYSAIRVASKLAEISKCHCILGSATPTIEDFYLAKKRGSLVVLSEKARKTAVKPEVALIDLKNRDNFTKNRYFSNALLEAISKNLESGKQTLIFHNRRGSAPLTICENCGYELVCPNCFLPLTLHVDKYEMRCHTCGYKCKVPSACPSCGGAGLVHKGFGTKLLENELTRLFPGARVRRFDADNKKDETLDALYPKVRDGEVDILVGTQVLAKGLDLPLLSTVGVVQADAGINLPDFAAEEKVFQLLTQVIGRVGRGHLDEAKVFVQTYQPENPVLLFAMNEDYLGFFEYLLEKRKKSRFPPFSFVAKVAVTMKTEGSALKKVREAYMLLALDKRFLVSPPCPAFHERNSRGFTWELTVRSSSRKALQEAFSKLDGNFHVSLDPPSLL